MLELMTPDATFARVLAEVQPALDEAARTAGQRIRRMCDDMAEAQAEAAESGRKELAKVLNEIEATATE